MPSYSRNEIVFVRFPFSDLTAFKVRPGIVVSGSHPSMEVFILSLTSKTSNLLPGEFVLAEWKAAGLHIETALKRGIFTIDHKLIIKRLGKLTDRDADSVINLLREWLGI